jgi:hypothetical protein
MSLRVIYRLKSGSGERNWRLIERFRDRIGCMLEKIRGQVVISRIRLSFSPADGRRRKGAGLLFAFDGGFDVFPEFIRRIGNWKHLAGRFGNGLKIGEQGAAELAILEVGMRGNILARSDQLRQLRLKSLAVDPVGVIAHRRPSSLG